MARIIIFGDSIGWGHNDNSSGGWADNLRRYLLKSNIDYSVYNVSISADSSREVLKRIDSEAKVRRDPEVTIFAIGLNDSSYLNGDKNKVNVKLDDFKKNLSKLYKKAKGYSEKIVFVGLFPCDEKLTMPVSWDKTIFYDNENILKYNDAIKGFCLRNKVVFIDLMDKLRITHLDDGLHPHSKGHKLIYDEVKESLLTKVLF